jgi:hypothetical protein
VAVAVAVAERERGLEVAFVVGLGGFGVLRVPALVGRKRETAAKADRWRRTRA